MEADDDESKKGTTIIAAEGVVFIIKEEGTFWRRESGLQQEFFSCQNSTATSNATHISPELYRWYIQTE